MTGASLIGQRAASILGSGLTGIIVQKEARDHATTLDRSGVNGTGAAVVDVIVARFRPLVGAPLVRYHSWMTFRRFPFFGAVTLSTALACGSSDGGNSSSNDTTGTGGATGSTGAGGLPSGSGGDAGAAAASTGAGGAGGGVSAGGAAGTSGGAGGSVAAGGAAGTGAVAGTGGTAGMGGSAGTAGTGGMGEGGTGGEPYVPPTGDPISAPDMTWQYVEFPGTKCRNGAAAGINVSLNSASNKVMIYLEGGGACFDLATCGINPTASAPAQPSAGVFNRGNADNPVADWNFIHVPYCTGDVHAGDNPSGDPGIGAQPFVGYSNLEAFLERIVPTFPNVEQVLHTGISAGGFGAALTADLVARRFPPGTTFTLIDDSGPPMSTDYLPSCLQQKWRELWGFDTTFLADCGSACPDPNDYSIDWAKYLADKYPNSKSGLISATNDGIITTFYGYGTNNCTGSLLTPVPGDQFAAGLQDFRDEMSSYDNFGTYYINSTTHTWIGGAGFYTTTVGGVRLVDWFRDIVEGTSAADVGP